MKTVRIEFEVSNKAAKEIEKLDKIWEWYVEFPDYSNQLGQTTVLLGFNGGEGMFGEFKIYVAHNSRVKVIG